MQRSLLALFWSMVVLSLVAAAGLLLDPRTITGAPAFEKPLKFAVSIAVYALSFGWVLRSLEGRDRLRRRLGDLTAAVLGLEVLLIFVQAARGVGSHFNVRTLLDGAIFQAMGIAILLLWLAQITVAVLLLRQRFTDPALAWALRFGMILAVLAGAVGFFMAARLGHTVGAAEGGAGMPLTNWSAGHGDLRTAHFLGLHALQLLPLLGWLASALGLDAVRRARLAVAAGLSYLALFLLVLLQALRGLPLTALPPAAALALGLWGALTVALLARALTSPVSALEAA